MMMNIRKRTGLIFSLVLLTAVQFFNTACSRRIFRESTQVMPKMLPAHNRPDDDSVSYDEDRVAVQTEAIRNETQQAQKITDNPMDERSFLSCVSQSCGDEIINLAMKYIGTPYRYGGLGNKGIDCSGFVMRVFEELGIDLPHNAQAQSKYGTVIKNRQELQKGDIVFFKGTYKTSKYITHTGIYNGNNMFVHASSGNGVTLTSMEDSWWKNKFAFGARVVQ